MARYYKKRKNNSIVRFLLVAVLAVVLVVSVYPNVKPYLDNAYNNLTNSKVEVEEDNTQSDTDIEIEDNTTEDNTEVEDNTTDNTTEDDTNEDNGIDLNPGYTYC